MNKQTYFIKYGNEAFKIHIEPIGMTLSVLVKKEKELSLYAQLNFLTQGNINTQMLLSVYRYKKSLMYEYGKN